MKKAIVSFGTGDAAKTLAVALPTFRDYADRHGYDLLTDVPSGNRPPSWLKVPLLQDILRRYDFALWLDADTIIVDGTVDIARVVPQDAFQGFVVMDNGAGAGPCLGVWALRAGNRTQRFLDQVWAQKDLLDHKWWEQAAAMRLMGWTTEPPLAKQHRSTWDDGSFFLPGEWDVIPKFAGQYAPARIRHYAADTTRRRLIEMRTDLAEVQANRPRQWAGIAERLIRPYYRRALRRTPPRVISSRSDTGPQPGTANAARELLAGESESPDHSRAQAVAGSNHHRLYGRTD